MDLDVKIHKPFSRIPLKGRQENAMKTLMKGIDKLNQLNIKHWIGCGSFLGLYREGKFIDWDLDIDISASYSFDEYEGITEKIIDAFKEWELIRTIHYKGRPFQIAFMSEYDVIFDITFYVSGIKEDKLVSYSDCGVVEEDSYLFNGFIPSPSEEYLEKRYGEDWKIPDGGFRPWNTYCKTLVGAQL